MGFLEKFLLVIIVFFVHELGHIFFILLFRRQIYNFTIYPFGACIDYATKNDFLYKELLISAGGILANVFFLIICFFNNELRFLNLMFIFLNILPILPLDGANILKNVLNKFFPLQISEKTMHFFSIGLLVIIFVLTVIFNKGIYFLFLILVAIRNNFQGLINLKERYQAFKLEKHLHPNHLLKPKLTRHYLFNPLSFLFYGYNTFFDYESFIIGEEQLLKKEYKM